MPTRTGRTLLIKRRIRVLAAVLCVVAAIQSGCSPAAGPQAIVVLAAASLRPTFTAIGERFQADHPGAAVRFDFASSSDLALQLTQGAIADVFASADTAQMDKVATSGLLAGTPVDFASNRLVIVTAPGNPKHVGSFADLAQPGLLVVTNAPPMPCGVATRKIQDSTGIRLHPISEEPNVEDVVNKVSTGEADAGLVNVTDAVAVGEKVAMVEFAEATDAINVYPIAVLKDTKRPELAQSFVDLVTGAAGQKILDHAGFAKP